MCRIFSCFSASENGVFVSKHAVGRKIAKIWAVSKFAERQRLNQTETFKCLRKRIHSLAIRPLSQCDKASIALPQGFYRNAKEPPSQRRKASIANLRNNNVEKIRGQNIRLHIFEAFLTLFCAVGTTFFCWENYKYPTFL
jgi:hypothetical protein